MRRITSLTFLALIVACFAARDASAQDHDTASFAFLLSEWSARSSGLAGADGASAGSDPHMVFSNPALLTADAHGVLGLTYLRDIASIHGAAAAYVHHLSGYGTGAVGVRYLGYGSFEERTPQNEATGTTLSAYDIAFTGGLAFPLAEHVQIGVNAHLLHSRIADEDATALAADGGLVLSVPAWLLRLGLSVHNLGGAVDAFAEARPSLPADLRLHVSKTLRHLPLTIGLTGRRLHEPAWNEDAKTTVARVTSHLRLSGTLHLGEAVDVRAGYAPAKHIAFSSGSGLDFAGAHFGVGVELSGFLLDYSLASWSDAGLQHRLTVSTRITE